MALICYTYLLYDDILNNVLCDDAEAHTSNQEKHMKCTYIICLQLFWLKHGYP